jgi:hypothetical protein
MQWRSVFAPITDLGRNCYPEFIKAYDGKKSGSSYLKLSWLGQCPLELELHFSRKQLQLPCSFFKVSMECSEEPVLGAGVRAVWLTSWQIVLHSRHQGRSNRYLNLLKRKINIKRYENSKSLSLTLLFGRWAATPWWSGTLCSLSTPSPPSLHD